MQNEEGIIYSQVYALINLFGRDYYNQIPDNIKNIIETKKDKEYNPKYKINIPLEEQDIHRDSLAIIANIHYNYWCKNDKEKEKLFNQLKEIQQRKEDIMPKYGIEDLFKNKQFEEEIIDNNLSVEIYKETLFNKIIKRLKKLFKK